MVPGHTVAPSVAVDSAGFIRSALAGLEAQLRELALLALGDWEQTGVVMPDLFRAIAALQRPSWGHWNGLLNALREARRAVLRAGGPGRDQVLRAEVLGAILEFLDEDPGPEAVSACQPLAELTRTPLPRRARRGHLLTLPISLRNQVAHFAPASPEWWQQAAAALVPLTERLAQGEFRPDLAGRPRPEPWFLLDGADLCAFNGLRDEAAVYATPLGEPRLSAPLLGPVLRAFQRLLGKSDAQDENVRRVLARLAPEQLKGVLLGDYLVGRPVGRGGFATVHLGTQLSTGRKVALKILRDGLDDEARARFQQEAVFLSRLNHANVVAVLGSGEEAWAPPREPALAQALAQEDWFRDFERSGPVKCYLVMEWVEGQTLEEVYQSRRGQTPALSQLAEWFAQAAGALAAVHAAGLLHRDVKPSNLMATEAGVLKLMDFGIARSLDETRTIQTTPGRMVGTPAYMAPEQLAARDPDAEVGPAADVYSLCATFYELFTGARLFGHDCRPLAEVEAQRLRGERPRPPRHLLPGLPWELDVILLGGLEPGPAERYPSALELEQDLRRFLQDEPIRYRRPSLARRLRLWRRRNPKVAGLTALVASLLVLLATGATAAALVIGVAREEEALARNDAERKAIVNRILAENERVQKEQAQASAYLRGISLADKDWLDGRVDLAGRLLEDCPAELRHWEWRYLEQLRHGELAGSEASGEVGVAFRPSTTQVLAAGSSVVNIWDYRTGKVVRTIRARGGSVSALAMSPDGRLLAVADNITVRVWDLTTAGAPRSLPTRARQRSGLAFSPDSKRLASVGVDLCIWDLASGQKVLGVPGDWVSVAFSPDGRHLAGGGTQEVVVLDAHTGWRVQALPVPKAGARALAFSPDGRRLAAGGESSVKVWDPATGREAVTLNGSQRNVNSLAFSPDGTRLATGGVSEGLARLAGEVRLWDLSSGQEVVSLRGHLWEVAGVAFSADGRLLASASSREVRVWDATARQGPRPLRGHTRLAWALAFSPDSRVLASAGDDFTILLWDVASGKELRRLDGDDGGFVGLAFSPDGRHLAAARRDGTVLVWDPASGQRLHSFQVEASSLTVLAYSPDGTSLALGGKARRRPGAQTEQPELLLCDASTGRTLRRFQGHAGLVYGVAFSPDGRRLASAGADQTVRLWDVPTGVEVRTFRGHTCPVLGVAFSPDGTRLASSAEVDPWLGMMSAPNDSAFLPDIRYGNMVGPSEEQGQAVKVWDVETGTELFSLTGHTRAVHGLAFSPDGLRLATAGADQTVRLWDPVHGQAVLTLRGHSQPARAVVFSPDGLHLASSGGFPNSVQYRGEVLLWDAPESWQELQKARRQAALAPAAAWHRAEFEEAWAAGELFAALFHLDRLAEGEPLDDGLLARRARLCAELGRREDALRHSEAAIARNPARVWLWYQQALIRLRLGDVKGYRAVCAAMLDRFEPTTLPGPAWRTVEAGVLLPGAVVEPSRLVQLGHKAVALTPGCIARHTLAAALYRAGRFEEAVREFGAARQVCRRGGTAWDFLFLAMAHQRLGQPDEAHFWLDKARTWFANAFQQLPVQAVTGPALADFDRVEFELLLREAESLVGKPPLSSRDGVGWLRRYLVQIRVGGNDVEMAYRRAEDAAGTIELPEDVPFEARRRAVEPEARGPWQVLVADLSDRLKQDGREARLWRARGLAQAALGCWEKAADDFAEALQRTPEDPEARLGRGRACAELGRWESAAVALGPTQREKRERAGGLSNSASLQGSYLRGVVLARLGRHTEALAEFDHLIQRWGGAGWAVWGERARVHAALGQWDRAAADLSRALELVSDDRAPGVAALWRERGRTRAELGRFEEAVADYSQALTRDSGDPEAWRGRGSAHIRLGQFDKAAADFSALLHLRPEDAPALVQRGRARTQLGDWPGALTDSAKACDLAPEDVVAWRLRAAAHSALAQWDRAAKACSQVIDLRPGDAWAWTQRGQAQLELGRYDQALADCDRALTLKRDNPETLVLRAMALSHLGKYDRALADFARAVERGPESWLPYAQRAALLDYLGRHDEELADLDRAIQRNPGLSDLWSKRGDLRAELGNWPQARADFARAVELKATSVQVWYKHALLLRQGHDQRGYAEACATLLQRLGPAPVPSLAGWAVRTCTLGTGADPAAVLRLAEQAAQAAPKNHRLLQVHGAALYRAGRFEEAVGRLEEACRVHGGGGDGWDLLFLAMARQRAGQAGPAAEALNEGTARALDAAKGGPWQERLILNLLYREAQELVAVGQRKGAASAACQRPGR